MTTKSVLRPIAGARWAISRTCVSGEFVCLVQNSPVESETEALLVLQTVGLLCSREMLDQYFPYSTQHKRCPTFALMSLWYDLSPANAADAATKV
jgi:hypothetical protein